MPYKDRNQAKIHDRDYYHKNKEIRQSARKTWEETNKAYRLSWQRTRNLNKYNITIEQYDDMFRRQNGLCNICFKPETLEYRGKLKLLSVDHCHVNGKVRGLLCNNCNLALGKFKDDILTLKSAIKYLEDTK